MQDEIVDVLDDIDSVMYYPILMEPAAANIRVIRKERSDDVFLA